ncbi:MAG TPA: EAL domain-containing protein [Edaphobacter sp.]|nr:EAL domain-containing protein [Edaphobacter sp.]
MGAQQGEQYSRQLLSPVPGNLKQRRLVEQILECMTDGVFVVDREWRFVYLSLRAKRLISGGEELIGRNLWEKFPEHTRGSLEQYHRAMIERIPTIFEEYYPEPLNKWFEIQAHPAEEGILVFFRDITERRRTEEMLRLRVQAIASVPIGVTISEYSKSQDCPLVYVNPAFEKLTGYNADWVLGKDCRFLQGSDTEQSGATKIRAALKQGQPIRVVLRNYQKNGKQFINELQLSPVTNPEGEITHIVGVQTDVTERIRSRKRLARQAQYDALTGIGNRFLFTTRLRQAIKKARSTGNKLAVVYLDVDNVKQVNDSLGHRYGDRILKQVAHKLASAVRTPDTVARLGGDEFAFLCTNYGSNAGLEKLMDTVIQLIGKPVRLGRQEVIVTASIGLALFSDATSDSEDLIHMANLAMYSAKRDGKNTWRKYCPKLQSGRKGSLSLNVATGLRRALERNEFVLYYQPRIEAATGRIVAMEALIRWRHPELGLTLPGEFIGIAEETGLIAGIGHWVIEEAIRQNSAWRKVGLAVVPVSVNVSAVQFRDPNLASLIAALLKRSCLPPQSLELELTESLLMDSTEATVEALSAIRALGVLVAIDDFGTGYSALSYLARLAVDTIKIDHSFTSCIVKNKTSAAICRSIIQLAQQLDLTTVAEGIETEGQANLLRYWGCAQMQGFYFVSPMPAGEMENLLKNPGHPGIPYEIACTARHVIHPASLIQA